MYGYAIAGNEDYLPTAVSLAHRLSQGLTALRKSGTLSWLKPDGKTQVTITDGHIRTILISTQHDNDISQEEIRTELIEKLIEPLIGDLSGIEILVNPTGLFLQGGFEADTGLTGRKIMVDTYGGLIPHGGGAFSGKDGSKVDRSAAYMARYVAKNIVASGQAEECLVSLAYAIGREEPLMITARNENNEDISALIRGKYDFHPRAIIEKLEPRTPIFAPTAAYGHFGRPEFPWEKNEK